MKKNLLSVLILILLVVNIAMTAVMMISITGTNKKTAELMDSIGLAMKLELYEPGSAPEVPLSDTETYPMGTLTVHLKNAEVINADGSVTVSDKAEYIVFDISLLMNTKHDDYAQFSENVSSYESMIKGAVEGVVANYTSAECQAGFTEDIKNEMITAIQNLFQSQFIYGVTLTNIKFG